MHHGFFCCNNCDNCNERELVDYTDRVKSVVFNSKVTNIEPKNNSIELTINGKVEIFDYVILATGHSARDTIKMLYNNKYNIGGT